MFPVLNRVSINRLVDPCNLSPFTQLTDHEWKHGFFLHCLTPVLTTAISAQPQPYQKILDVDKTIRDFNVPPTLDIFNLDGIHDNRQLTMQQVLVSSGREIGTIISLQCCLRRLQTRRPLVLLQLHRNFFTEAVSDYDAFSYQHKFAPSAVATYLSASRLIATLNVLEEREPQLSKRFMCFWFNAFSGAVRMHRPLVNSTLLTSSRALGCSIPDRVQNPFS